MAISPYGDIEGLSRESRMFLQRTARSLVEVQPKLNSIPDIVVFLEVLGFTNKMVVEKGFEDLHTLARYIYEFVDYYSPKTQSVVRESPFAYPIPSVGRRLGEALGLAFPWVGALVILAMFGVSLWLALGLPLATVTLLIAGVYAGLLISEGPIQSFTRLFSFYYNQSNLAEAKRILKRSYYLLIIILSLTISVLYTASFLADVPVGLVTFASVGAATIAIHRVSYVVIFALKKVGYLMASYAAAFAVLLSVYYMFPAFIPSATTRYLVALASAFATLSITPAFYTYKVFGMNSKAQLKGSARMTFNPLIMNEKTIRSKFGIQMWETAPYYLFGTFFFMLLFSDRVLSWIFNPIHRVNGVTLPLVFNTVYHSGADLALFVIFPATIIQYIIMAPIFEQISNLALQSKVTESSNVDHFLRERYALLMMTTIIASAITALFLILVGPSIVTRLGASETSVNILRIAAIGDVFITIFLANGIFMLFLGKVKPLAFLALACSLVVIGGGIYLAHYGFQNIVYAYLVAAMLAGTSAFAYVKGKIMKRAGSIFFSKYI